MPEGAEITEVSPESEAAVEALLDDLEADIAAQIAAEGSSPIVLMRGRRLSQGVGPAEAMQSVGAAEAAVTPVGVGGVALQITTLMALVVWLAGLVDDAAVQVPASLATPVSRDDEDGVGSSPVPATAGGALAASPAELVELLSGLERIKGAVAACRR